MHKIRWNYVIVNCVLLCAFLPKFILSEGVNVYLPEVVVFAGLIFGIKQYITFYEQRLLLVIFSSMLFFSILAQNSLNDTGAVLRSFKEILYIPIIYWASKVNDKEKILRSLVYFGCFALLINIIFYLQGFSADNTIWSGADSLSSGMSNKGFDFSNLKIVQLKGLAHGIWGSYCVLIFVLAASLRNKNQIKSSVFFLTTGLFIVNMLISISREAILIIVIVSLLYFINSKQSVLKKALILLLILMVIGGVILYGSNLPVVQKLSYTYDSVSSSGSEGNVQLRLNTWAAYGNFLGDNFQYLFIGLGISPDNFFNNVHNYTNKEIVSVPESAVVYVQAYGGIVASIALQLFLFIAVKKANRNLQYVLLKYYFVGIIATNLFSGVSMFSDLLYANLCLVYGLLIVENKNDSESIADFSKG